MQDTDVFTLVSSNGEEFQVPVGVARQSAMLAELIEGTQTTFCRFDGEQLLGVPVIDSGCLKQIIEFCKYHLENPPHEGAPPRSLKPDDMCDWDKTFVSEERLEKKILFDLILASNYLRIKDLTDVTCKGLANRIKGKSPQEIVSFFKEVYPFDKEYTPDEEEAIRKQHPWIENPSKKITK